MPEIFLPYRVSNNSPSLIVHTAPGETLVPLSLPVRAIPSHRFLLNRGVRCVRVHHHERAWLHLHPHQPFFPAVRQNWLRHRCGEAAAFAEQQILLALQFPHLRHL